MIKRLRPIFNVVVKGLLRSPLHRIMSKGVLLITFQGRRSGKQYTTPASYLRDGQVVYVFSNPDRKWWRNLRGGVPVRVLIAGRAYSGTAEPVDRDERILERAEQSPFRRLFRRIAPAKAAEAARTRVMIRIELS
jgi:deazaflavin-dependent oxidoreductase (nitroreductase family)